MTYRTLLVRALPLLAAAAGLTACSSDAIMRPDAARPASIVLSTSAAAPLASLGDTALVRARVLDATGDQLDGVPLRWTVRQSGVLQQDAEGVFRAIGNGRVTLVAQVDVGETGVRPAGYYAAPIVDSVVVEVRQRAARLALAATDTAFSTLGAARQLRVAVTDARGNAMLGGPPPLAWHSADARVATVDSLGVVRSLGEGVVRIDVRADSLAGAATFTVSPRLAHTSCMVFAARNQTKQACVTLDFVVHEREGGR